VIPASILHQFGQRPRAIQMQYAAGERRKPVSMFLQTTNSEVAVIVARRPFDEIFGFPMPPAAGRDCIGAEAPGFAGVQTPQADGLRRVQEHHQIEMRNDRIAPAVQRSAQHSLGTAQKHLAHQPRAVGDLALVAIGRRGRLTEIVIGVMMRHGQRIGHSTAEAVTPASEAPMM
jgi:hypothetical protein